MGETGVGEIESAVNLLGRHRWVHGVDAHHPVAVELLPESSALEAVALLLDMLEIGGLRFLVAAHGVP